MTLNRTAMVLVLLSGSLVACIGAADGPATAPPDAMAPSDDVAAPGPDALGALQPGPCVVDGDHWRCQLQVVGPGYLVVARPDGTLAFRRAGVARWNGPTGLFDDYELPLLGYAADATGALAQPLAPIPLPATLAPQATTRVGLQVNLASDSPLAATSFDRMTAEATATFSTTVNVIDSLGATHPLALFFVHVSEGEWEWHALRDNRDLTGGDPTSAAATEVGSGSLAFGTDGLLVAPSSATELPLHFASAAPQSIALDFGPTTAPNGPWGLGSTTYAGTSSVGFAESDGYPVGALAKVTVNWTGELIGVYSNRVTRRLGRLALALFDAPPQLASIAPQLWAATPASGAAALDNAWTGGRGGVASWTLDGDTLTPATPGDTTTDPPDPTPGDPPVLCPADADPSAWRLAVDGAGYLVVGLDGERRAYRRDGVVRWSPGLGLTDADGAPLLGYAASASGVLAPDLTPVLLPELLAPRATTGVWLVANLDSNTPLAISFDPIDPENTSSFSTSVVVADSLGARRELELYFAHDSEGQWSWHALAPTAELAGGDPASTDRTEIGSGTLTFDTDGNLVDPVPVDVWCHFAGASLQTLTISFGDASGTKQWAGASTIVTVRADGSTAGWLTAHRVALNGDVIGHYSNGETRRWGQLPLALFTTPSHLYEQRPGEWITTSLSPSPTLGPADAGLRGAILDCAL